MTDKASIESIVLSLMKDIAKENELQLVDIKPDTVLLDSGLNSLGFAVLVAGLEDELGYDPFFLHDEAYYPTTFADFVAFYQKYESHRQ